MLVNTPLSEFIESLGGLPFPVYATDTMGQILLWNVRMAEMSGVTDAKGRQPSEILCFSLEGRPVAGSNPFLATVVETGRDVCVTDSLCIERADNACAVDLYGVPLIDAADGRILGGLAIVQDASSRRLLSLSMESFQATAGHDLRNGLSVLEGYLPMLLGGDVASFSDGGRSILESMQKASHLLGSVVTLLIFNSRFSRGLVQDNKERLLLHEIFLEASRLMDPVARNKDVSIDLELDEEMLVVGSRTDLYGAFANLLYAAAKFARNRTSIRVTSRVEERQGIVEIVFVCRPIAEDEAKQLLNAATGPRDPRLKVGLCLYFARLVLGDVLALRRVDDQSCALVFSLPLAT
jgi:signal transduction histidine kinase